MSPQHLLSALSLTKETRGKLSPEPGSPHHPITLGVFGVLSGRRPAANKLGKLCVCQMTARRSSLPPSLPNLFFFCLFASLGPAFAPRALKTNPGGSSKLGSTPNPPSWVHFGGHRRIGGVWRNVCGALSPTPRGLEGFVVAALLSPFLLPFSWHFSLFGLFFTFLLGK